MISPFCPKCKYKVGAGSTCPVCGTSLNSLPSAYEEKQTPKLDNRVYDVHFGYRHVPKTKFKKEKKINESIYFLGIGGIIILILLIILSIII